MMAWVHAQLVLVLGLTQGPSLDRAPWVDHLDSITRNEAKLSYQLAAKHSVLLQAQGVTREQNQLQEAFRRARIWNEVDLALSSHDKRGMLRHLEYVRKVLGLEGWYRKKIPGPIFGMDL